MSSQPTGSAGVADLSAGVADLRPLLSPRSIAIIGSSEDPDPVGRPASADHAAAPVPGPHLPGQPSPPDRRRPPGLPDHRGRARPGRPGRHHRQGRPGAADVARMCRRRACAPRPSSAPGSPRRAWTVGGPRRRLRPSPDRRGCGCWARTPRASSTWPIGIPVTFSPTVDYERGLTRLVPGNVAVVSQSGGLGFALFNWGQAVGLGSSYVVSTGNEADLGALEIAAYLLEDAATDVVALLVEGFRDGEQLSAGGRAGPPPSARSWSWPNSAVRRPAARPRSPTLPTWPVMTASTGEAFASLGVVRVDDQEDLLDALLRPVPPAAWRPAPGGHPDHFRGCGRVGRRRVRRRRSAGARTGCRPCRPSCARHMPSYGSPRNPVDVTAEVVNRAGVAPPLELLASSPQVDAIVLISSLAGPHMLRREEAEIRRLLGRVPASRSCVYSYTHPGRGQRGSPGRAGRGLVPEPGPGRPGRPGARRRRSEGLAAPDRCGLAAGRGPRYGGAARSSRAQGGAWGDGRLPYRGARSGSD